MCLQSRLRYIRLLSPLVHTCCLQCSKDMHLVRSSSNIRIFFTRGESKLVIDGNIVKSNDVPSQANYNIRFNTTNWPV